jgi:hypothetical protein
MTTILDAFNQFFIDENVHFSPILTSYDSTQNRALNSKPRTGGGLTEALLSFIKIDNMPDSIKILAIHHSEVIQSDGKAITHVGLHIEILQVEGVFPDVHTDDRNVRKERVLVSCGDNLQLAG